MKIIDVIYVQFIRWSGDISGQSAMEYGVIIAGTALLVSVGVFAFGDSFVAMLGNLTTAFTQIENLAPDF